ncbi:MAG: methionyl-tRNA formyltransferase [Steroidobacterales bacterium]
MHIAFAGTPEFALPALRALAGSEHRLVGVLTQPDRPAGRGRKLHASPVKQFAQALNLPIAQPARLRSEEERAQLLSWRPELLVVVAYGLILPPAVLALPRFGCLNIHASLLPRWRGAAPIQRAILAGDDTSGVTIMQMDAGLDTGPILRQQTLPVAADATAGNLHDSLAALGAQLLLEVIGELADGRARGLPQAESGATYAAKVDKAEAQIDWQASAAAIDRKVRAFNPWPIAETRLRPVTGLQAVQVRIWSARPCTVGASGAGDALPGTVLRLEQGALIIACGDGALAVRSLQLAGRRVVTAAEFAQAHALAGLRFG